jgi:hypothetical protein
MESALMIRVRGVKSNSFLFNSTLTDGISRITDLQNKASRKAGRDKN